MSGEKCFETSSRSCWGDIFPLLLISSHIPMAVGSRDLAHIKEESQESILLWGPDSSLDCPCNLGLRGFPRRVAEGGARSCTVPCTSGPAALRLLTRPVAVHLYLTRPLLRPQAVGFPQTKGPCPHLTLTYSSPAHLCSWIMSSLGNDGWECGGSSCC